MREEKLDDRIEAAYQHLLGSAIIGATAFTAIDSATTTRRARLRLALGAAASVAVIASGAGVYALRGGDQVASPAGPASTITEPSPDTHGGPTYRGWYTYNWPYANHLFNLARQQPNFTENGIDTALGLIRLWGVGEPAPVLQQMIDDAPPEVIVRWIAVPYTSVELRQAVNKAFRAIPAASMASRARDYAGVVVWISPPASRHQRATARSLARSVTDIPVKIRVGAGAIDLADDGLPQP